MSLFQNIERAREQTRKQKYTPVKKNECVCILIRIQIIETSKCFNDYWKNEMSSLNKQI